MPGQGPKILSRKITSPPQIDYNPSSESGVYRRQIASESLNDPHVQGLCQQLKEWINDVLTDDHIVVKDLCEDLSDGQVLSALIGQFRI